MLIDINCDLGEGIGNDEKIMPYISSCNIACGGHAGDKESIKKTIDLANKHHVKVGAHPSYPDKENFGRKSMKLDDQELSDTLLEQIENLQSQLKSSGKSLHHIKAHGALYNKAAKDEETAILLIDLVKENYPTVPLYVPFGSLIAKIAQEKGVGIHNEVFADRNYNDDLSLVSRSEEHAILKTELEVVDHIQYIVKHNKIKTASGKKIDIIADTLCIHGDHPGADQRAKTIHFHIQQLSQ